MISQKSLKRITDRQANFRWGDTYQPAILAIPGEAPKGSRICRLNSRKLERPMHLMSIPERVFTQLALFHPGVFEIHEQKMLHPEPHVHPLHGHHLARGLSLLPVAGTVCIADRIGMEHAMVVVETPAGDRGWAAYPYVGDLLLYISDSTSRPYAVNWNIKLSKFDFAEKQRSTLKSMASRRKDQESAKLRLQLEEKYYESAGIRTVNLSLDDVDTVAMANLDQIFGAHDRRLDVGESVLHDFSEVLKEDFHNGRPLALSAIEYGRKWGKRDQFITRIYQDIWNKKLPVDLFQYIQIDQPLAHSSCDVIERYKAFFAETA